MNRGSDNAVSFSGPDTDPNLICTKTYIQMGWQGIGTAALELARHELQDIA